MKTQITHLRFEYHNQRHIAMGVLVEAKDPQKIIMNTSLLQILKHAEDEELEIVNAQEVLDNIVRLHGFAS